METSGDKIYWTDSERHSIWRYDANTDRVAQINIPFGRIKRWNTAITDEAFYFLTTETGCFGECSGCGNGNFSSSGFVQPFALKTIQAPQGDRNVWRIGHNDVQASPLNIHEVVSLHNGIVTWRSEGTEGQGTQTHFRNLNSSEQLMLVDTESFERFDRVYYFTAEEPDSSQSLWATDLTERWIVDSDSSMLSHANHEFAVAPDRLTFYHRDGQLWTTDATRVGTKSIADGFPSEIEQYDDFRVFYTSPRTAVVMAKVADGTFSYWVTDGTENGTKQVATGSNVGEVAVVPSAGEAYFTVATVDERQLWQSASSDASVSFVTTVANDATMWVHGNIIQAGDTVIDTWSGEIEFDSDRVFGQSYVVSDASHMWSFERTGGLNPTPWKLRLTARGDEDRFFELPEDARGFSIVGEVGSHVLISISKVGTGSSLWWLNPNNNESFWEVDSQKETVYPDDIQILDHRIFYFSDSEATRSFPEPESQTTVSTGPPAGIGYGWWSETDEDQFRLGTSTWATDGTPQGTQIVADNWEQHTEVSNDLVTFRFDSVANSEGDLLYGAPGHQLLLHDEGTGAPYHYVVGDVAVFLTTDLEIWTTDGTVGGTIPISKADHVDWYSPRLGFLLYIFESALWRTDGTLEGTVKLLEGGVRDFDSIRLWGGFPSRRYAKAAGNYVVSVIANEGAQRTVVWLDSDGNLVAEIMQPRIDEWWTVNEQLLMRVGDELFGISPDGLIEPLLSDVVGMTGATDDFALFALTDSTLWSTDGTFRNTVQLFGAHSGTGTQLSRFGTVFLDRDGAIWQTDGTLDGTREILPTTGLIQDYYAVVKTEDSNQMFFELEALNGTKSVWAFNGGDHPELVFQNDTREIELLPDIFGKFAFFVSHGHGGYKELWASDGTANGTRSMGPYQVDQHKARIVNNQLVTIEDYGVFAHELSIGHNYGNPIDTTGDGVVVPRDALVVINELNRRHESQNHGKLDPGATVTHYYDVNQDGYVSPIDAIRVINWLIAENKQQPVAATAIKTRANDVAQHVANSDDTLLASPPEFQLHASNLKTDSTQSQQRILNDALVDSVFQRS